MHELSGRLGNSMFQFAFLYAQYRDGLIPDIYVQGEQYFDAYKDEVRELYSKGLSGKLPYVAVHVRRGDYVNNPFYVDLFKDDYYERAMAEFPGERFMIFSDDIAWCKKQAIFKGSLFSEYQDEVTDLNDMSACIGHIIANSSFSWWGAWLSPHEGKVIAPKKWFSDGAERVQIPASWKRI